MPYADAAHVCNQAGSILAEPRTADAGGFMYKTLQNSLPWNQQHTEDGVWIGLRLNSTGSQVAYWNSDLSLLHPTK